MNAPEVLQREWRAVSLIPVENDMKLTFVEAFPLGGITAYGEVKDYAAVVDELATFVVAQIGGAIPEFHVRVCIEEAVTNIKRYGHSISEVIDVSRIKILAVITRKQDGAKTLAEINLRFYDNGPDLPMSPQELAVACETDAGLERPNGRGFCYMLELGKFAVTAVREDAQGKYIQLLREVEITDENKA